MLAAWMFENKSTEWSKALPYVQAVKNSRYHQGIGRSPYEALFGHPIRIGPSMVIINKMNVATASTSTLTSITEESAQEATTSNATSTSNAPIILEYEDYTEVFTPSLQETQVVDEFLNYEDFSEALISTSSKDIEEHRAGARKYQAKQATKMLEASKKK
jgi:hypothetical protein